MKSLISRAIACVFVAIVFLLVPSALLADWVKRQQPLAHAFYVPKNYVSAKSYPLVIVIHGNGWQGSDNRVHQGEFYAQHLAEARIQDRVPHFIYVPQCPAGQTWVDSPWEKGPYSVDKVPASKAMTKLTSVLEGLQKEFSIDPKRIYLIGISMGGQATWDLVCRNPKMFSAAVPICGCGDPAKANLLGGGRNLGLSRLRRSYGSGSERPGDHGGVGEGGREGASFDGRGSGSVAERKTHLFGIQDGPQCVG